MEYKNYLEIELFEKYSHIYYDGYTYYYKDFNYTTFSFQSKYEITTFIYNLILMNIDENPPNIHVITDTGCIMYDTINNRGDLVYYIDMLSDIYPVNENDSNVEQYIQSNTPTNTSISAHPTLPLYIQPPFYTQSYPLSPLTSSRPRPQRQSYQLYNNLSRPYSQLSNTDDLKYNNIGR